MILKLLLNTQMMRVIFAKILKNIIHIYKNIGEYNPNKKRKILIIFDDIIANMLSNKKLNLIVTKHLLDVGN